MCHECYFFFIYKVKISSDGGYAVAAFGRRDTMRSVYGSINAPYFLKGTDLGKKLSK